MLVRDAYWAAAGSDVCPSVVFRSGKKGGLFYSIERCCAQDLPHSKGDASSGHAMPLCLVSVWRELVEQIFGAFTAPVNNQ
jgi:hypothetical protein